MSKINKHQLLNMGFIPYEFGDRNAPWDIEDTIKFQIYKKEVAKGIYLEYTEGQSLNEDSKEWEHLEQGWELRIPEGFVLPINTMDEVMQIQEVLKKIVIK